MNVVRHILKLLYSEKAGWVLLARKSNWGRKGVVLTSGTCPTGSFTISRLSSVRSGDGF